MLAPVRLARRPALVLFGAALLLHLILNGRYPIFRDELYYIVCGWHLALGYMDQPPLSPLLAALSYSVFGTWTTGFRLVPALCFATTAAITVELARRLGAGRFGAWLAGGTVFAAGVLQILGTLLTTDILQPPAWTACAYALVRAVRDGERRWWLWLGVIAGIAFLGKYNVAIELAAAGAAIALLPQRRALASWRPWAAALIAAAIAAPNLLWQQIHGWPFLAHIRDIAANHTIPMSFGQFLLQQLLLVGPPTLPVWGAGLLALLASRRFAGVRWLGLAYLLLLGFGWASHGKPYYIAPYYPVLFAAGAVAWEDWVRSPHWRAVLCTGIALPSLALSPLFLPVLPPGRLATYLAWLDLVPETGEKTDQTVLPQYFADAFGWQEMVDAVDRAWRALPQADRAKAVFIGRNYGEAAAVDVLGRGGGPPAISLHQSYWYWGPKGYDGSVALTYGASRDHWLGYFRTVEQVGHTGPGWGMPFETDQPVWLCRDSRVPLDRYWPGHMTDN